MSEKSFKELRKERRAKVRNLLTEGKLTQLEITVAAKCSLSLVSEIAKEIKNGK